MAALKIGFTRNEWCGLSVPPYALRNDADSSSDGSAMFFEMPRAVKSRPLPEGVVSMCELPLEGERDEPD
jgi:hypothetical protein